MATNPYFNKVVKNNQTIIDLTSDTVTPASVLAGVTFHDASGAAQVGTASAGKVIDHVSQRIVPTGQTSVIVSGYARYAYNEIMDTVWSFEKTIQSNDADPNHWVWSHYENQSNSVTIKNGAATYTIASSEVTTRTEQADNYSYAQYVDGISSLNGRNVNIYTYNGGVDWTASDDIIDVSASIDYANRTIQLTAKLADGTTEQSDLITQIYEASRAGIKRIAITDVKAVNPTGYQIVTDIYYTDGTHDTYTQAWPSADGGEY